MASFVVMEPPVRGKDPVLVRDGFHVFAFLVPVVWLLVYRLWIEAGLALLVTLALGMAGSMSGFSGAPLLSLLVSVYVGLEGAGLRVSALRRRGWHEWGVVDAETREDADERYVAASANTATPPAAIPLPTPQALPGHATVTGPALGLFSYPGRG